MVMKPRLDLYSRIYRAPEAGNGVGDGGGAEDKGSAPGSSAPAIDREQIANMLYGGKTDVPTSPESPKPADAGVSDPAAKGDPVTGKEASAEGAPTSVPTAPVALGGTELTAEKEAELTKALAEAPDDAAKAAAQKALDDAKAEDAVFKADRSPFDEGKLVMPDGVEVDSELLKQVAPEFKAAGLGQKAAQIVVDRYIKIQQAQADAHAQTVKGWIDSAKADKRIGGANWDKTVSDGTRAIRKHAEATGDQSLVEILNGTGMGNHPGMISFAAWVGAMVKDDTPVTPQTAAAPAKNMLDVLYPGVPQGRS